ncbi:unnamed protein product [Didymodactylos carnosus]|uniref:Rhodanese domain-containing protein n=1 Tax=Didymodactylos carnosus TaxID=1234261 RepID=A0A813SSF5_9BILA|nr:unnamed protein product [Didymodactylos carnosus]CAF1234362.1 unnamed protein product [Didymodactylos carnosus]CAF3584087.1 unnamed protein product [Didymodactylos carnosus]CAF4042427.1 unnamed protein product [Didymodactylos carnosus]
MNINTLVQLIIQVVEINSLDSPTKNTSDSSAPQMALPDNNSYMNNNDGINSSRPHTQDSQVSMESSRSTLQRLIREMDVYGHGRSKPIMEEVDLEYEERPYLIVDLRDRDDYNLNHIIGAYRLLFYSKKNKKGKIIVLYDDDERIAPKAVTIIVERGYNNVFLLSGGLRYCARKFPEGLLTGSIPASWTKPQTPSIKIKRTQSIDHNSTMSAPGTSQSQRPNQGPYISLPQREHFTSDDIEKLTNELDLNLLPSDSGSRLSRASTMASKQSSRSSIASQRSNVSSIHEKPWKPC